MARRRPFGRGRRRAFAPWARRGRRSRWADRGRQRRRRPRGARPSSRRTSTACSTRSPASQTRNAGGGGQTRLERARHGGALGGESWFRLGDRDLGLHPVRTQALREGVPLSAVTARLAAARSRGDHHFARDRRAAPHLARHADGSLLLPGVVRRPRTPRSGRPRSLRRRDGGAAGTGCARGAARSRPDPDRAEQSVRLDRPDPRRRANQARSNDAASRASPSAR